ncbi:LLM class flavin-dependent oxidoreductase [Micromonospora sp. STR1_7]|uniref:LLM class flavin-dependent oxidoreductase n=1 Tax=Micromonospora parastrephiae TaxID=2806101 RepID=A0ABS1XNF6_9ACTN|nr:LLM class flavin-dependent oxidoreductase [Micromonospora parastrephiae]MBM0230758.1 LLM class flavin-dependent oxidoreductase [Micromonospora parastrephiae]
MRYGVLILPDRRWAESKRRWVRAEQLGFDHAWTYDHLMWRWLRDKPWFGAVPTLAAAASATSRIRLGTMVASPTFRHPVTFAKELMALDDLSEGRITCGLGAGAGVYDDEAAGGKSPTPRERSDRFAEFVDLTDRLLRSPTTSYEGRYFSAHEVRMYPGCVQRPRLPFAVAATGPRGMRVAAEHGDLWVTAGEAGNFERQPYEQLVPLFRKQTAALGRACEAAGRDPASIGRVLLTGGMVDGTVESADSFFHAADLYAEIGFTDMVVHWPREEFPYEGREEIMEEIATRFPAKEA